MRRGHPSPPPIPRHPAPGSWRERHRRPFHPFHCCPWHIIHPRAPTQQVRAQPLALARLRALPGPAAQSGPTAPLHQLAFVAPSLPCYLHHAPLQCLWCALARLLNQRPCAIWCGRISSCAGEASGLHLLSGSMGTGAQAPYTHAPHS